MNLLDLTPRQLKRSAPIKNRSTNLKKGKQIRLTSLPDVLARRPELSIGEAMGELDKGKPVSVEEVMVSILFG